MPRPSRDDTNATQSSDPRILRSRARLLDAAAELLKSGGMRAVTVDAVVGRARVARTTLYHHFDSLDELLVAAVAQLIPPVTPPPQSGPLRQRLIEIVARQATLIEDVPVHLAALAWLVMGTTAPDDHLPPNLAALRDHAVEHYRAPFEALFELPEIQGTLGDFDTTLALSQLIGPIVFAKLTGLRQFTHVDCAYVVDDFLRARAMANPLAHDVKSASW